MHFLARLLNTNSNISEELSREEHHFQEELQAFLTSYTIKQKVLRHLVNGEPLHHHLHKLQYALKEEISSIQESQRAEKEILQDLKYLSKETYISHLEQLSEDLHNAKERDMYVRKFISELYDILHAQAHKVRRALGGETDLDLRHSIIDLLTIERHLVERLVSVEDFRQLFGHLSYGTRRQEYVSAIGKRFEEKVEQHVRSVIIGADGTAKPESEHYLAQLTARLFNRLSDAIMRSVQDGTIEQHPYVDVEYVNSPHFEEFVDQEIQGDSSKGKLVPSERTINIFIKIFRQLYNRQNPMVVDPVAKATT